MKFPICRSYNIPCSTRESKEIGDSSQLKYPSRASKNISNRNSMSDENATKISPVSDARKSSAGMDISRSSPLCSLTDGSKRSIKCDPVKGTSTGLESFQEFEEKVIRIEES